MAERRPTVRRVLPAFLAMVVLAASTALVGLAAPPPLASAEPHDDLVPDGDVAGPTVAAEGVAASGPTASAVLVPAAAPGRPDAEDWTGAPFTDEVVVSGLTQSISADFLPDGRMLVLGKKGHLTLVDPAQRTKQDLFTMTGLNTDGERGALDVVVSPQHVSDRQFFVYYTGSDLRMHIDRYTMGAGGAETVASRTTIWTNPGPTVTATGVGGHLGGAVNFGPDGKLYVSIGETTVAANSQDLTNVFGKVLRINRDGTVPADNPFADGPGGNADEIWAYGLRNPFPAHFDAATGLLWLGDVGGNYHKNAYEEVNVIRRGHNYGWPLCEGPVDQPKNGAVCPSAVTGPVAFYGHELDVSTGDNASLTGGEVYRGARYTPLTDTYIYGDYAREQIRFARLADDQTLATDGVLMSTGDFQPTWIGAAPDGTLYYNHFGYSGSTGQIRRILWTGAGSRPPVISTATATPSSGAAPLAVRFSAAASDPDGTAVTYRWAFGDGASSTDPNPTHTYTAAGTYLARLEVTSAGETTRSADVAIHVGSVPTATITSPADGSTFRAGDTLVFRGRGTDDGVALPESQLRWDVDFVHDEHTHPVTEGVAGAELRLPIGTSGHGYEGDTGYRVTLTVTDPDGLQAVDSIRVDPRKVAVRLETNLPGTSTASVDGITQVLPFTIDGLDGFHIPLEIAAAVCHQGEQWVFDRWSSGDPRAFTLAIPSSATTLRSTYRNAGPATACPAGRPDQASTGYWMVAADGTVHGFDAPDHGDAPVGVARAEDLEPTPSGHGYWVVADDGSVFAHGDAPYLGSATAPARCEPESG